MRILTISAPRRLAQELARHPELEVVVMDDPARCGELQQDGHFREVLPFQTGWKTSPRAAMQIRRAINSARPDLVHAFYGRPLASTILATTCLKFRPRIVSFRGVIAPPSALDPASWLTYLHPRVAGHACESNAVKQGLVAAGIDPQRCAAVYNNIALGTFPRPGRAELAAWNIPGDAFVVGTVANIRPVKGTDILLRAAIQCADLTDVYWLLIGSIRDSRVTKLCGDPRIRERVRCLGFQRDACSLISAADLFVMASRQEGLCVALLEAMSQEVCPVVSDAGGMKEVVRDRQDGLVFPTEDVAGLALAIRELHADRQRVREYAASARERVQHFASASKMAERTLELYQRVMAA